MESRDSEIIRGNSERSVGYGLKDNKFNSLSVKRANPFPPMQWSAVAVHLTGGKPRHAPCRLSIVEDLSSLTRRNSTSLDHRPACERMKSLISRDPAASMLKRNRDRFWLLPCLLLRLRTLSADPPTEGFERRHYGLPLATGQGCYLDFRQAESSAESLETGCPFVRVSNTK